MREILTKAIFYDCGGKSVMKKVMQMSSHIVQGDTVDNVVARFKPQKPEDSEKHMS